MLYIYLFHGHASCLHFSQYTILLSGTLYVGTSYCLMSSYFTVMLLVYLFTVYYFTFWYITCRNVLLLNVYLFHGHASCQPFSQYTILLSGTLHVGTSNCLMSTYFTGMLLVFSQYTILLSSTLYVGTSNCFMSTYFTDMCLVYLFHGKLFYFLVHYEVHSKSSRTASIT